MKRLYSRLAAAGSIRQVEAVVRADAVANAANRAVRRVWVKVLRLAKDGNSYRAALKLKMLMPNVHAATATALHKLARWGWRSASRSLVTHVPRRLLAAAAVMRTGAATGRRLHEDEGTNAPTIDWLDLLFPYRDRDAGPLTDADWSAILFPPPSELDISRAVYSSGWVNRIAAGTRLGDPLQLADLLVTGLAQGKTHQEIAKDLLPHLEGVRSTARRVARTEGLRVAGAMQQQAHDQLGDLVIGYSLVATLDSHSRPWHAHRNGRVYYLDPKPGQSGPDQMPHPPDEPRDLNERPPGAPATAWNCRCTLVPVLSDPGEKVRASLDALSAIPEPAMMSDWFQQADPRRRRIAVGSRRYNTAREILGREPEWHEMLNPATGDLLSAADLRSETRDARTIRVEAARLQVQANRQAKSQLQQYGTVLS